MYSEVISFRSFSLLHLGMSEGKGNFYLQSDNEYIVGGNYTLCKNVT